MGLPGTRISVDGFKWYRHVSSKGTLRRFLVVRLVNSEIILFLRCLWYQVLRRQSDNSRTPGKNTLKVVENWRFCSVAHYVSFTVLLPTFVILLSGPWKQHSTVMSSAKEDALSPDELRKRLYQTFKNKGVLDTLKVSHTNNVAIGCCCCQVNSSNQRARKSLVLTLLVFSWPFWFRLSCEISSSRS